MYIIKRVLVLLSLNLIVLFQCSDQGQKTSNGVLEIITQDWSTSDWKVGKDDHLQIISDGSQQYITAGNPEWTNYSLETSMTCKQTDQSFGLLGRYQDSTNYYLLAFEHGFLVLKYHDQKIGGAIHPVQPDKPYRLKLVQRDGLLAAYVNEKLVFQVHDYTNGKPRLTHGKIGLFASGKNVTFDDIKVQKQSDYTLEAFPPPDIEQTKFRKTRSLSGIWDFSPDGLSKAKLRVPDIWAGAAGYDGLKSATYETQFDVPADFLDFIQLEFDAVNDHARVYINDHLVGEHSGKDVRFALDVSNVVQPGSKDNTLKVEVRELDKYHPHGWWMRKFGESNLGIRGHVRLNSYPKIVVDDVIIKTSTRKNEITVLTTIRNTGFDPQRLSLRHQILDKQNKSVKSFSMASPVVIDPESSRTVTITQKWSDAQWWWPDDPYLYTLKTSIIENAEVLDENTERFGFREVWTEGSHYMLNGVRLNLRGDSVVDHGIRIANVIYASVIDLQQEAFYEYFMTREGMEKAVDNMLDMNFNSVRTHMGPALETFYDVCDEKGLMVTLETVCYGSGLGRDYPEDEYELGPDGNSLMDNTNQWIRECVKQFKNHPSIVMWSASNEAAPKNRNNVWDLDGLTQTFRQADDTRLVIHHRDQLTEDGYVFHYTYSHNSPNLPDNLYDNKKVEGKPTGEGEFYWVYDWHKYNGGQLGEWQEKVKGQGLLTRGYRYNDYAYIRPYRMNWGWKWGQRAGWNLTEQYDIIKKSMAAVAVFDKEYDDLYDDLLNPPEPPEIKANSQLVRNLVIYNDEFRGDQVEVRWQAKIDDDTIDSGVFTETIVPGYHIDKNIAINVPAVEENKKMVLVLSGYKDGQVKYQDDSSYWFSIQSE